MMSETENAGILIASAHQQSIQRVDRICRDQGKQTKSVCTARAALKCLEDNASSKDQLKYPLLIAHGGFPDMDMLTFFTQARQFSPQTRRMLVMEENPTDDAANILFDTINQAGLHGLVPAQASDEDISTQITHCLDTGAQDHKYARVEELTTFQNKQMFGVAQRLKKKDATLKERIQALEKKKAHLNIKLEAAFSQTKDPVTLADRLKAHKIPTTAKALAEQFTLLAGSVQNLFEGISSNSVVEPLASVLERVASTSQPKVRNTVLAALNHQIMRTLYASPQTLDQISQRPEPGGPEQERPLHDLVTINISPDRLKALITLEPCTTKERESITLERLLGLLHLKEISFGIAGDEQIESWIKSVQPGDTPFEIAAGNAPVQAQDATITYMFETNYTNPGKIMPDGSIDFRDRGTIPFVRKDDLIAQKRPAVPGKEGVNIAGDLILVDDPADPVFLASSGTRMSDDESQIYADVDGHPHLDPMGELSVNPELNIEGDIDYNTGNVDFNGHIIISGRVRQGFSVKGVSLTAREVEGATLELSGDLCVSDGITDTTVFSVGNIYTKFINNCKVYAFGDIVIQKEIIDAELLLSGTCQNPGGTIMGSQISARNGIEAGRIGTPSANICTLRTGVDDHVKFRMEKLDKALDTTRAQVQGFQEEIEAIEDQDLEIYAVIAAKTREQTSISERLEALKSNLKKAAPTPFQTANEIKAMELRFNQTEQALNSCFDSHEKNLQGIDENKKRLKKALAAKKSLMLKKNGLTAFDLETGHTTIVTAQKGITQGTVLISPNAFLTLPEDQGRCKIQELSISSEEGVSFKLDISEA